MNLFKGSSRGAAQLKELTKSSAFLRLRLLDAIVRMVIIA